MIDVGSNVQAVFGTQADALKNQIKDALAANPVLVGAGSATAAVVAAPARLRPCPTARTGAPRWCGRRCPVGRSR